MKLLKHLDRGAATPSHNLAARIITTDDSIADIILALINRGPFEFSSYQV